MKPKSKILIIAGSDSSGGAGIQADIKTVTALGSYAMTAITAVTSQNTLGVKSIISIIPKEISNQILFSSRDIKPNAIKIGMLHSSKVIKSVVNSLDKIKIKKGDNFSDVSRKVHNVVQLSNLFMQDLEKLKEFTEEVFRQKIYQIFSLK